MNYTDQLKRQHQDIFSVIMDTNALVKSGNIEANSQQIAMNISSLAGKLQVHLSYEDKYLYPKLLESDNPVVKSKAKQYIAEMGDLSSVFTDFKNRYNTKPKILAEAQSFKSDYAKVFTALETRMNREDKDLYLHI